MADKLNNLFKDVPLTSKIIESPNTLIVLDTNTLLKVYRDSPEQTETFIKYIKKNINHIFIPYIVALEFGANYKRQRAKLKRNTIESIKLLESSWKPFTDPKLSSLPKVYIDSTKESKVPTESLISSIFAKEKDLRTYVHSELNKEEFKKNINDKIEDIKKTLLESLEKQDEQFNKIISLITEKIASIPDQKLIDEIQSEGDSRYLKKRAPGFNDEKAKKNSRFYTIEYETKYGDLILWKEILRYYKENSSYKSVLLITGDGSSNSKHDWGSYVKNPDIKVRTNLTFNLNYLI